MSIIQAAKRAASFVAKELRGKAYWVWEKRTLFLPSARFLKERRGRQAMATLAVLTIVAVLVLVRTVWGGAGDVPAGKSDSDVGSWVWTLLAFISEWVASLLGQLLLWAIDLLIQISKYNSFLDANVVSVGWVLVRDVANMFFILIMLVIAFGTMLKIEAYSWKKLLPRLILTALLVNFSKTFLGLLIDFSQVIMLTFVNGYAAAAGGNFMELFQIRYLFQVSTQQAPNAEKLGSLTFSVAMGFALGAIMLGIALIVVLIFAAILVFRIITLWILIVLSPLAFLLGTFPKGQEYYGQWWKQLQGQIIVGPMVAFFLWLSLAALGGGDINSQIKYEAGKTGDMDKIGETAKIDTKTTAGDWDHIASFAVSIAMLLMSLQMIQQLGVAGGGLASGALSMIKSKATGLAKKLAVPVALGMGVPIAPLAWGGAMYGAGALAKFGIKKGAKYVGEGAWTVAKQKYYESRLSKIPLLSPTWYIEGSRRREEELKRARTDTMAEERMRWELKHNKVSPNYRRLEEQRRTATAAKDLQAQCEDSKQAATLMQTIGYENWKRQMRGQKVDEQFKDKLRGMVEVIHQVAYNDDQFEATDPEMARMRGEMLYDVHGYEYTDKETGQTKFTKKQQEAEAHGRAGTVKYNTARANTWARMLKDSENYRKLYIRGSCGDTREIDDYLSLNIEEEKRLERDEPEKYRAMLKRREAWSDRHQAELGVLNDVKTIGLKQTSHYENVGLASSSGKKLLVNSLSGQAAVLKGELVKLDTLTKAKVNPHSFEVLDGQNGNVPLGMSELGQAIWSAWARGQQETNLDRNVLMRTANNLLGFGPQEEPIKKANENGGWVRLNEDYVRSDAGAEGLQKKLADPVILKTLFAHLAGIPVGAVGKTPQNFNFLVGDIAVSLAEILAHGGDIKAAVDAKQNQPISPALRAERDQAVEYDGLRQKVEAGEASADEASRFQQFKQAEKKSPLIAPAAAATAVADEIEELTGTPDEELRAQDHGEDIVAAVDDFRRAVEAMGVDKLQSTLGQLTTSLKGTKSKDELVGALKGKLNLPDGVGGFTPEAHLSRLLYTLAQRDNKRIIDVLTRISRAVSIPSKKKGKKDEE